MAKALNIPWPKLPFLRLLLPFVLGILIQSRVALDFDIAVSLLLLSSFVFAFSEFRYISYGKRWIRGVLINLTFLFLGCTAWSVRTLEENRSHYTHFSSNGSMHFVQLLETPVEKNRSFKVEAEVVGVANNNLVHSTMGKVLIYLQKDSAVSMLGPGQVIQVNTNFQPVQKPSNPGQFDYGAFLQNRGVHRTAYVRTDEWIKTDQEISDPMGPIRRLRASLLELLSTGDLNGEEGQIASALLLGYKEDLDPEVRNSFVEAGAMHVLAVSGLHVGIVFMALSFLFSWIERFTRGKVIKVILIIGLIWIYALLTGSSPSVIRASVMFSMIGLAGVFQRHANIYNTLAASAFVMLMFDPALLYEVGFQLSYSAVLGIVALYSKFRGLLSSRIWILNKIWDLTSVSIAAQIGTLPLSLYYFHQMPSYSFLSNLIVIPAAFAIISIGGLYLIFFWLKPLALIFSKVLWSILWCTNSSMKWIGDLPASVVEFSNIGSFESILLYGLIIGIFASIIHIYRPAFKGALVCSALLLAAFIIKDISAEKQEKLVVFDQRNGILMAHVKGRTMTIHADSIALSDTYTQRTIDDAARHYRVKQIFHETLKTDGSIESLTVEHSAGGFSILLSEPELYSTKLSHFPELTVLPSSIKSWQRKKIQEQFDYRKLPSYSTATEGALIIDLES